MYGKWQVDLPGETHVWEPDEVTLGEQLTLETESGQSYQDWVRGVGDERAEACQILVWFLRRKAGTEQDRAAVDFPIRHLDLTRIVDEVAVDPEAPAGSEPATSDEPSTTTG